MASALEVGKKLVELCKQGKDTEAVDTLYASNVVSVEAMSPPGQSATKDGIEAIRGKHEWWYSNHEVHSASCAGPWPHGDRFIVTFKYEITPKFGPMNGKRFTMEEAAVYTVKDGKIVKEEFFYNMGA